MKKKTLKAILAAALAVIMVIPCFSAFAANDTLVWFFYGDEYVYDYAGEVTLGTTAVPNDISDYIWYSFDIQNDGFYYIHYSYEDLEGWMGIPENLEGNTAYDETRFILNEPDDGYGAIYYLETGKNVLAFDLSFCGENAEFETEYLGAEITEIMPQYDLIYNYDIYEYEHMGVNYIEADANFQITFSGGQTANIYYLDCTTDSVIVPGENTFKAKIYEKEYQFTANVYYITDYVESVEISNIEDYLYIYEYYNGTDYEYPYYETIRLIFKDGSTYTVNINSDEMLMLPNGREVGCYFDFVENNGEYTFDVYVGGTCFASYECEVTDAGFEENVDVMTSRFKSHLSDAAFYIRRAFRVVLENGLLGFFDYGLTESILGIEWAVSSIISAFDEITYFMFYLLS